MLSHDVLRCYWRLPGAFRWRLLLCHLQNQSCIITQYVIPCTQCRGLDKKFLLLFIWRKAVFWAVMKTSHNSLFSFAAGVIKHYSRRSHTHILIQWSFLFFTRLQSQNFLSLSLFPAKGHLDIYSIIAGPYQIIGLTTSLLYINCKSSDLWLPWQGQTKWFSSLWAGHPPTQLDSLFPNICCCCFYVLNNLFFLRTLLKLFSKVLT